jgi:hypothetical protein
MAATRKGLGETDDRVEHALMVERVLTRLGWLVLMLGVIGLGAITVEWLSGDLTTEKALAAAGGTARLAGQPAPAPPAGTENPGRHD